MQRIFKDEEMAAEAKTTLENALTEYFNGSSDAFYVQSMSEVLDMMNQSTNMLITILTLIAVISLVVGGIGIMNIMLVSVTERTKEIGILRALGARKKDVTRVFNAETFIIGLCSGILGITIANLLTIPINKVILNLTQLENVAKLNPMHAITLIIISIVLTLIGGWIPAKMASKKDPVNALRVE